MVLESNRELVLRRLLECLGRDRTKHQVAEVTSLGLVQMTRKRVGPGLLEAFSEPCECCNGRGVIVTFDPDGDGAPAPHALTRGHGGNGGHGTAVTAAAAATAERSRQREPDVEAPLPWPRRPPAPVPLTPLPTTVLPPRPPGRRWRPRRRDRRGPRHACLGDAFRPVPRMPALRLPAPSRPSGQRPGPRRPARSGNGRRRRRKPAAAAPAEAAGPAPAERCRPGVLGDLRRS